MPPPDVLGGFVLGFPELLPFVVLGGLLLGFPVLSGVLLELLLALLP